MINKKCAYIYIETEDGECYFRAAELKDANFDVTKGQCYAAFESCLKPAELNGAKITKTGFATAADTSSIISGEECEITKKAGESLCLRVVRRLNPQKAADASGIGAGCVFTGGENELVKAVLGVTELDLGLFELAAGNNYMPAVPACRALYGFLERLPVTPVISAGKITFSGTFSASCREILLLYDEKVVLRSKRSSSTALSTRGLTAAGGGSIELADNFVTDVFGIQVNSAEIYDAVISCVPESVSMAGELLKIPENAVIRADYFNQYFAVVEPNAAVDPHTGEAFNGGRITFYTIKDGEFCPYFACRGDDARLCSDGTIVVYGYGETGKTEQAGKTAMFFENGETAYFDMAYDDVTFQNEVVCSDGKYLLASVIGNNCFRYMISGDSYQTAYSATGTPKVFVLKAGTVSFLGTTLRVAYSVNGIDTSMNMCLETARTSLGNCETSVEARRLVLFDPATGMSKYVRTMDNTLVLMPREGRILSDFFVENDGPGCVVSFVEAPDIPLIRLEKRLKQIFRIENDLYFVFDDGRVERAIVSGRKTQILSSSIMPGYNVDCYVRLQTEPSKVVALSVEIG